jgi:hypothetical protein
MIAINLLITLNWSFMKKLLFALLLAPLWLHAQMLTGTVYKEGADSVVVSASVYYSGTTMGTLTNQGGSFYLPIRSAKVPLVISCVGYYSTTVNNYKAGESIKVYLKPKQEQLQDVVVRADGMAREAKEKLFVSEFIGSSAFAKSCVITNLDDVDLVYSKKLQALQAFCSKPLIIQNKMLGYTITYYLDRFSKSPNQLIFAGNYIFKETNTGIKPEKIIANREKAYNGSRMQFIRALWYNKVENTGFKIYNRVFQPLLTDSIVVRDSLNQKYVRLKDKVYITHQSNMLKTASLLPVTAISFIDKDGFYGLGLRWSGTLANHRIGDLLPFEYQSERELKAFKMNIDQNAVADQTSLTASVDGKSLSSEDKQLVELKKILLMPNNGIDPTLVVKKWQQPVRYKIYSTSRNQVFDNKVATFVSQTLGKVSNVSGLPIENAVADSLVNLWIIVGDVKPFEYLLLPQAAVFLKQNNNTCYYTSGSNGFNQVVIHLKPGNVRGFNGLTRSEAVQNILCRIRVLLMKGLGFNSYVNDEQSLFYPDFNWWGATDKLWSSDEVIIKTLYSSKIKPGMNGNELAKLIQGIKL